MTALSNAQPPHGTLPVPATFCLSPVTNHESPITFSAKCFNINTYEICVCNSFNINTYKNKGLKVV